MATLSTIANECRIELGEPDGVSNADSSFKNTQFIAFTNDWIRQYGKWLRLEELTVESITLVDGTKEYNLPSGFSAVDTVIYRDGATGDERELAEVHPDADVATRTNTTQNTTVNGYYIKGYGEANMKIGFNPTPSSSDNNNTVKLRYYRVPTEISTINDTVDIPNDFLPALKMYLIWRFHAQERNLSEANGYESMHAGAIRLALKARNRRKVGRMLWFTQIDYE